MKVYLGADHRGFQLKEYVQKYLSGKYEVFDLGDIKYDADDDYPDFAKKVAEKISKNPDDRGILVCGSGAGVAIVANKFRRVRAATVHDVKQAFMARNDEDINVLALPANFIDAGVAQKIVDVFLTTPFSTEVRHRRRVKKIE